MALLLTRPADADTERLEEYRATGGYMALDEARRSGEAGPDAVLEAVKASGLRGRGGAGFPVWQKWELARSTPRGAGRKHVVVNGGEHEPGSVKDRVLLAKYPHRVLEGALLAALATGASSIVFYLIEDMADAIEATKGAIAEATVADLLVGLDVQVALAPTTYVAGEETAALEVIEGRKAWPRKKPPYPGVRGLHDEPTTIQNVETLAWVAGIARHGIGLAEGTVKEPWFSPGAMLCTLDESFARPGLVEVPLGTTFRQLVDGFGGGTRGGRPVKAILPALSSAFLPASALDTPMLHEPVRVAGSNLGCGGVSVIEEGTCIVERALAIARFFKQEQCGQCPPCRMETATIAAVFEKVAKGPVEGDEMGDYAAQIAKITAFARGKGNCSLIEMAAAPALSALRLFPEDFAAHAATGKCPPISS